MPTFKHPCPHCAKWIERDVRACPHCGVADPFAPGRCPTCRTIVEASWIACPKCGTSLTAADEAPSPSPASATEAPVASPEPVDQTVTHARPCAGCGAPLAPGARFCTACGTLVTV